MKNKILITGATGFVGANLVRAFLKNKSYEVNIITRKNSNLWRIKSILGDVKNYKVDLLEKEKLKKVITEIKPDYIIHLAIYGGRPFENDDEKIIAANFQGTINLLEACNNIDYKIFLNTGSSSEYGKKSHPMEENEICEPINIYGISKLSATLYCNYIANRDNKNIGTIRLFSPFGDYEGTGRLFPDLILNALENKTIELGNPKAVRDFIYIDQVIKVYEKIINENINIKGEIFNLGFGEQHSVEYCAKKVLEYTKSNSKLKFGALEARKSDSNIWVSDMSKTKKWLKLEIKLDFDSQIKKACEWFAENKKLYNIK